MEHLANFIYVFGALVIVILAWQSVDMIKRLKKRIKDYNENEREEVERNPYQALVDLEAERDTEDEMKKRKH